MCLSYSFTVVFDAACTGCATKVETMLLLSHGSVLK